MKMITRRGILLALILLAFATSSKAQNSFTENFNSWDIHYTASTTADWNRSAGQLQLFPFTPSLVGTVDTPSAARGVEVHGNLAFVADGYAGLQVIDVSDPAAPAIIGTYNTPGYVYQVRVQGNIAYLADHSGGLQVVDVSDPANPGFLGSYTTSGVALGLCVAGDYAYVAFSTDGVAIVDVSNPASPTLISVVTDQMDTPRAAAVDGNLLYVANGDSGLIVVDVANPALPTVEGKLFFAGHSNAVVVRGDFAYVSSDGIGLVVCYVGDPTSPQIITEVPVAGTVRDVTVSGTRAFLSNDAAGLQAYDVSDPGNPVLDWTYDTSDHAYAATLAGNKVFMADLGGGLAVIEVAEVNDLVLKTTANTGFLIEDITVNGDRGFVALGTNGFQQLDLFDPLNAQFTWPRIDTGGFTHQVVGSGNHAFMADGVDGLLVYDVESPGTPVLLGSYNPSEEVLAVAVQGGWAYLGLDAGVRPVNVRNPLALTQGGMASIGTVTALRVDGEHCWALVGSILYSVGVTDPFSPTIAGSLDLGDPGLCLDLAGDLLVVGTENGARVVDISDPQIPLQLATFLSSYVYGVAISGQFAVTASSGQISGNTWNLSNPAAPLEMGQYTGVQNSGSAVFSGEYLHLVAGPAIRTVSVFQREFDTQNNRAVSTPIERPGGRILAARVADITYTGGLSIEMRSYNLWYYESMSLYGNWKHFDNPGTKLNWQAYLEYSGNTEPTLSQLKVEWLNDNAQITSVEDIPNDQGRQVRLQWRRSGYDFVGQPNQITEYAVYREFSEGAKALATGPDPAFSSSALLENASAMAAAGWDFVTTVPVLVQDDYAVVVPTLADSTSAGPAISTFKVVALTATPGEFFTSQSRTGYSVDNLAPGVPVALSAAYGPVAVDLQWDDAPEPDFRYFRIYRATDPGFIPGPGNLVQEVALAAWTDPTAQPWSYHYKVTAVDFAGNESDPASAGSVTDVPGRAGSLALHHASPNPFNPTTDIRFELPSAGLVRLVVTDISGRVVRTLVDGHVAAGDHHVKWHGLDEQGRRAASGVYLYRMVSGDQVLTRRMTLLK